MIPDFLENPGHVEVPLYWRVAQAFNLLDATSTLGAPSLRSCKGGYGDAGTGEARPPESPDSDRVQVIRAVTAIPPVTNPLVSAAPSLQTTQGRCTPGSVTGRENRVKRAGHPPGAVKKT
jgi:hypothetical protein